MKEQHNDTIADDALRAKVLEDFRCGRVGFHLLPGGRWGLLGLAVAAISTLVSIGIVVIAALR